MNGYEWMRTFKNRTPIHPPTHTHTQTHHTRSPGVIAIGGKRKEENRQAGDRNVDYRARTNSVRNSKSLCGDYEALVISIPTLVSRRSKHVREFCAYLALLGSAGREKKRYSTSTVYTSE